MLSALRAYWAATVLVAVLAAVPCGAAWIVTHNVRQLTAGAARFGVEVLTPGEALRRPECNVSELRIELPPDVEAEVARRAGDGPSAQAAWVAEAVRQRLAGLTALEYLEARAARGDRAAFDRVLQKVPAVNPSPGDEW
jgi:hypothetical protein